MGKEETTKRGRKSKKSIILENLDFIKKAAASGASEEQIYDNLGIGATAWYKYKNEMPELKETINNARINLVVDLKSALIKKALGYEYTETKTYIKEEDDGSLVKYTEETTKHQSPDTGALINALCNYDDAWYRDKRVYDLKKEELELKKKASDMSLWK